MERDSTPARCLVAAGNRLQTAMLRLGLLAAYLPFAAVVFLLFVIEALLTREKRRLRGGREHGFIFHRLQRARTLSLWLPFVLYLILPATPHPVYLPLLALPPAAYVWTHMVLFKRNV